MANSDSGFVTPLPEQNEEDTETHEEDDESNIEKIKESDSIHCGFCNVRPSNVISDEVIEKSVEKSVEEGQEVIKVRNALEKEYTCKLQNGEKDSELEIKWILPRP